MNLTPRDVNYFLAVVQYGRLAAAAEACHVTQPALTKAIQRLEAECGLRLFERDARGTHLTAEGARFKEVAESLSRSYENALRVAADVRARQSGLLRVGFTDATRASLAPPTLAALLRQRPGLRATFQIGHADQLVQAVKDGSLDVAVVPTFGEVPEGCDGIEVGKDPHLPVMSARHPLARRAQLAPSDLVPYGWIHSAPNSAAVRSLRALFAKHLLPPPIVMVECEFPSEATLALVRDSELLAMVPRSLYRSTNQHGLHVAEVRGLEVECAVSCLTRADAQRTPLTQAFRELIRQQTHAWRAHELMAA